MWNREMGIDTGYSSWLCGLGWWISEVKNRRIKLWAGGKSSHSDGPRLGTQQSQRWLWPQQVFFAKRSAEVYSSGSPRSKIRSALRAEWTRTKAFKKSMHNKPTNKERKYGKFTLQGNIAHNWMLQSKNRKIKVQREATSSSSGCLSSLGTQQLQRWLWPQQVFFAKVLLKFTVVALLGAKSDPHWGRNGREPKRSKNPCTINLRIKRGSMGNSLCKET